MSWLLAATQSQITRQARLLLSDGLKAIALQRLFDLAFTSVSAGTGKTTGCRRLCTEDGVALGKGATSSSSLGKVTKDGLALGGAGPPSLDNQKTQPFKRPSRRAKWYQWWQRGVEQ